MSEWLDKLHEGAVEIDCVVAYLNNLSNGFEMTGNMTMAQKLYRYSEKLQKAANMSLTIFNKSLTSFLRKDGKSANDTIESVSKLEIKCKEINRLALEKKGELAVSIGYIVDSIRRIGDYSSDISENVINYLTGEEK